MSAGIIVRVGVVLYVLIFESVKQGAGSFHNDDNRLSASIDLTLIVLLIAARRGRACRQQVANSILAGGSSILIELAFR